MLSNENIIECTPINTQYNKISRDNITTVTTLIFVIRMCHRNLENKDYYVSMSMRIHYIISRSCYPNTLHGHIHANR